MVNEAAAVALSVVLLGLLTGSSGVALAQPRNEQVAAGRALAAVDSVLAAGTPQEAVRIARSAAARYGDDPLYGWQLTGRLGNALLRAGAAAEALPLLESAVQHEPHVGAHHLNLGLALLETGRRGRALAEFAQAVEADPGHAGARLAYGQLLVDYRDYARAGIELSTARRLCGGCLDADRALARLHVSAGDWAAAVEPLRRLQAEEPAPAVRRNLLAALDAVGDDEGLEDLLGEVAAADWNEDEWRYAVRRESRLQDEAPASRRAVAALADSTAGGLPRDDARFWGRVALNLQKAGAPAEGLVAVDLALRLEPDNGIHHNNRAVLLMDLGREAEARRAADEAARLRSGGGAR